MVRNGLRSGATESVYERGVPLLPKLGRSKLELDSLLALNASKPRRDRPALIRVDKELRELGMRAAMALCAGTPGAGIRGVGRRSSMPMCR
jgi:hypothetical protein